MTKPKQIKDAVRLSVVISREQANQLGKMAIHMSTQEGRQITVSEAIRRAIEVVYPIPNQMNLFQK
jgi:hypothetical protein